jgi:predicted nucleotidyltransferase
MPPALRENERTALAELKEALSHRFGPVDVRLYGSAARGQSATDSDLDVMVILEKRSPAAEAAIDDIVFRINLGHACLISTVIYDRAEIEYGPMSESPLYKNVVREGVPL